ncbi:MAG: CrcB family protein [Flavobacteriales bacterium]|nr:CrcB family protein [Flavobacteriales bacterium]
MNIVAIFIGGGLGSLCRYALSKCTSVYFTSYFAYATLFSNVLSTLILASFVYFFQEKMGLNDTWKFFVITGFCGGFSTFSTFSFETFEMLKNGQSLLAIINVLLSVFCCLFILYILYKTGTASSS